MVDTLRTSGWRFSPGGGGEPGGAFVRVRTLTRRTVGVALDPGAAEISCARPGAVPPASAAPVPGKGEDS
jgi:hypothetical protein